MIAPGCQVRCVAQVIQSVFWQHITSRHADTVKSPLPSAEESPRPSPRSIPARTSHGGYQSCPQSWCRSVPLLSACASDASPQRYPATVTARRLAAVACGWQEAGPRRPERIDRWRANNTEKSSIWKEPLRSEAVTSMFPCRNTVKLFCFLVGGEGEFVWFVTSRRPVQIDRWQWC